MAEKIKPPQMTEPAIVQCTMVEGVYIEVRDELVRLVGFIDLERTGEIEPERRIVARVALPTTVARALIRDLRISVGKGGH